MANECTLQMEKIERDGISTGVGLRTYAAARKSPGIVILHGGGEILHLNDTAWGLLTRVRSHGPVSTDGMVPQVLMDLCREVEVTFGGQQTNCRHSRLEATRLVGTADGPVLLRALSFEGTKDASSKDRRFLILLEAVAERGQGNDVAKERFGLTEREWQVTQALTKGLTNKEIGNVLKIAEPTVKSHIKHIMQKMKCTTRTAIVSHLAGSTACGSACGSA